MKIHMKYCTYIPALVRALEMVEGEVLELGAGVNSTFFLHWMCECQGRKLVTYENNKSYYEMFVHCVSFGMLFIGSGDFSPTSKF